VHPVRREGKSPSMASSAACPMLVLDWRCSYLRTDLMAARRRNAREFW